MHISSWKVGVQLWFHIYYYSKNTDLMHYASKMVTMCITELHVTYGLFICTLEGRLWRPWLLRWTEKRNLKPIKRKWPSALGLTSFKCIFNIVDFDVGARNSKYTLLLETCGEIKNMKQSPQSLGSTSSLKVKAHFCH